LLEETEEKNKILSQLATGARSEPGASSTISNCQPVEVDVPRQPQRRWSITML